MPNRAATFVFDPPRLRLPLPLPVGTSRPARPRPALVLLTCLLCAAGLTGCDRAEKEDGPPKAISRSVSTTAPGFLDPAPPPPESDTLILSGGTLLGAGIAGTQPEGLFDAIVVVRNGKLLGFGRRGAVDVPADSVGIDTSGRFLEPVGTFAAGAPVTLNVYRQRPEAGAAKPPLTARFAEGRWQPLSSSRN